MPSLIRFLVFCGIVAGIVYGGMYALVLFVEPTPREITIRVPTERVNPLPETEPGTASGAMPDSASN